MRCRCSGHGPKPARPARQKRRRRQGGRNEKCHCPLRACRLLDPELSLYRDYTVAMLRRYFRMSIELGRLPSILGREFFRAKVTSYRMHSFEDVVIFVHDVDRCVSRLDPFSQQLIARVILQEHTHEEAAVVMRCSRKTISRLMPEALDKLSEIFLATGILRRLGDAAAKQAVSDAEKAANAAAENDCQEGEIDDWRSTA